MGDAIPPRRTDQEIERVTARTGTVTAVQRFGGGLNLTVHFHTLPLSPAAGTPDRWTWAALMRRGFDLDVLAGPRCGGRLRVIATVQDTLAVEAILAHPGRERVDSPLGQTPQGVTLAEAPPAPAAASLRLPPDT